MPVTEVRTLQFLRLLPGNQTTLPYEFKCYPAEHADGIGGAVIANYTPPLSVVDPIEHATSVDYEIEFTVAVIGNPQETTIYWGHGAQPNVGTLYKRTGGVVQVNTAPEFVFRYPVTPNTGLTFTNLAGHLWWTKAGVGADPSVSDHIKITITSLTAIVTVVINDREWTYQVKHGGTFAITQPLGASGRQDFLVWFPPPLPPDWELASTVTVNLTWSGTASNPGADGSTRDLIASDLDTGPFLWRLLGGTTVEIHAPVAVGKRTTWPSAWGIEIAWNVPPFGAGFFHSSLTLSAELLLHALIRPKGAGSGGPGGGGTAGATPSQVGGSGESAAERLLGIVTVDAIGFDGVLPVDSGAAQPTLTADLHWVNGIEEGQLIPGGGSLDSAWTEVSSFGAAGAVAVIDGFHGASRYAVRFTDDNVKNGGSLRAGLPNYTTGTLFMRLYFRPQVLPSTTMTIFDWVANVGVAPFYVVSLEWLSSGKLRVSTRTPATADSAGVLLSGDRIEMKTVLGVGGSVECRIFSAGDGTTPRETITIAGNPAPGGVAVSAATFQGNAAAGQTGTLDMDDMGISRVDWLGPGTVLLAVPSSDQAPQWARIGMGVANYQVVDDMVSQTLDDTNYLITSDASKLDRYGWLIPRAEFAKAGSIVKTITGFVRGMRTSPRSIRQVLWDEADRKIDGPFWAPPSGSPSLPAPDETMEVDPKGRSLVTVATWNLGIEGDSGGGSELRVQLLHANLDVLERD